MIQRKEDGGIYIGIFIMKRIYIHMAHECLESNNSWKEMINVL